MRDKSHTWEDLQTLVPNTLAQGLVVEYLVLWRQPFLLIGDQGIEIDRDFGTDSTDTHAQARMKSDAAANHVAALLGRHRMKLSVRFEPSAIACAT